MAGIKHHTQALNPGKIPKMSYNEEHDVDDFSISLSKLLDHNKAVHDALGIAAATATSATTATNATNATNAVNADKLDNWHLQGIIDFVYAQMGYVYESLNEMWNAIESARSKTIRGSSSGFVQNGMILWDTTLTPIPEGFIEVDSSTFAPLTVVKFIGGENTTDCIIRVFCYLPTDTSVEIGDDTLERYVYNESGDGTQKVQTFVVQKGSILFLTIYNNSETDRYLGFEYESAEDGREHAQGATLIPNDNGNQFKFVADQSGDIRIWED